MYPAVTQLIHKVSIPRIDQKHQLRWRHTSTGDLLMKEAYEFKNQQLQTLHWVKCIWSKDIPPARSLFAWRFMHNKVPTDENLMLRDCNIPSLCSICFKSSETSFHLFFECYLATKLWSWLASTIKTPLLFSSKEDIWKICDRALSPQCKW